MVAQAYRPDEFITAAEYLEEESLAETKSEYINGHIYAMAGASRPHSALTRNVGGLLYNQLLDKSYEPFGPDMRVRVSPTRYTYPDLVVACEPIQFDERGDTLLNPKVIIEVLSPFTEAYDRGEKFAHYSRLESLTDYILIRQDRIRLEHFRRQENGDWLLHAVEQPEDVLTIDSIGCRLVAAEVYERVPLPEDFLSGS